MWYDKTNVVFYKDSHNKRIKCSERNFTYGNDQSTGMETRPASI